MTETFTAFKGQRRVAGGSLAEVALALKRLTQPFCESILIFSDTTGRAVELDLCGSDRQVLARLADPAPTMAPQEAVPPSRGRPKLGVVAREVTLLPRHWEWLNTQPGGASVALRRLVEEARRTSGDKDRRRAMRDAAYHFMSAMAGDLPNFEEASRALFADDRQRFVALIAGWPADIRDHLARIASAIVP